MSPTLNERVATEVRAELGRQRISVNELARRLGWSQPYLSRRVSGTVAFDLTDLERIANELRIGVTALIAEPIAQAP